MHQTQYSNRSDGSAAESQRSDAALAERLLLMTALQRHSGVAGIDGSTAETQQGLSRVTGIDDSTEHGHLSDDGAAGSQRSGRSDCSVREAARSMQEDGRSIRNGEVDAD
ncbi:hypothetical protein KEM55_004294 [Ascosphaera atra]|nr:hypothetical protein KEM55_004294 [Ascosphaera atra]